MLVFLLATVVAALVGGLGPALVSAVAGAVLLNYFFTAPLHTLGVSDPNNARGPGRVRAGRAAGELRGEPRGPAYATRSAGLAEIDRTRTALLAAVGHDLRTPLAAAKAAVSTLRSVDLDLVAADRRSCSPPPTSRSTGSPA